MSENFTQPDPNDPFQRPSNFSQEDEEAIFQQLQQAQEKLRERKEQRRAQEQQSGAQADPGGDEPSSEGSSTQNPPRGLEDNYEPPVEEYFTDREEPERKPSVHTIEEFERLLKCGYGYKNFIIDGNDIRLKTISQRQQLEALKRSSSYPDGMRSRIFLIYSLVMSIESINGKRWYKRKPLKDDDDMLDEKYDELLNFSPAVIDIMINEYDKLTREIQEKALEAKKDLAPATEHGST